jgi:hypothetical protein
MLKNLICGGAFATLLLAAGCGKADEALKEVESLKKRACACADIACAMEVQQDLLKWADKHKETKGTQSQQDKANRLFAEISTCIEKAAGGAEGDEGGGEGEAE